MRGVARARIASERDAITQELLLRRQLFERLGELPVYRRCIGSLCRHAAQFRSCVGQAPQHGGDGSLRYFRYLRATIVREDSLNRFGQSRMVD